MTYILNYDLHVLKMYFKFVGHGLQKLRARTGQTDAHTQTRPNALPPGIRVW